VAIGTVFGHLLDTPTASPGAPLPRGSRRATLKDVDANDGTSIAQDLRPYFEARNDIVMAFVFGSQATGAATCESDVDIAVYFDPSGEGAGGPKPANVGRQLDIETDRVSPGEDEVWNDIEDFLASERARRPPAARRFGRT
jgi:predicted nucleotidyltransferase